MSSQSSITNLQSEISTSRTALLVLCGALGLAAFPATAGAQFLPAYVPPNPLYQHPAYGYQLSIGTTIPTTYGRAFIGVTAPFTVSSKQPPPAGIRVNSLIFCLRALSKWLAKLTAFGS